MLFIVVDLTQWTYILEVTKDPALAMSCLKELSQNLLLFVETNSEDFDKGLRHTSIIESHMGSQLH